MTPSSAADLTGLIVGMDQRGSLSAVRERLATGEDPRRLLEECRAGMEQVGKMFESGEYFVSALIMAGEIFRQAADMLLPLMTVTESPQDARKAVIATVKGDIHDIGKNIAVTLLEARGFTVVDLGVDVEPERVARTVVAERPDVLGLSCLLTSGFEALRETITLTREHTAGWEQRLPVVIGGTAIDQRIADHADADGWCTDAADGIAVVQSLME
ncbi:MAG: cobalamin-dependent protein [Actinobacteria bacterium]|nr:cobalamin-dependent protein [Actinomycetota bacterium]